MKLSNFFLSFLILFSILASGNGVGASSRLHNHSQNKKDAFKPEKLFVFGDSYADTGNDRFDAASWNKPYGKTYPGYPAGRYSDGLLLTDFVAMHYGFQTPIAYRFVKASRHVRYGVNFAYGGTGVFDTGNGSPNMTAQIDLLKELVKDSVITKADVESSLCVLSVFGNDYVAFIKNHTEITIQDLIHLAEKVVNQTATNMKTLHALGAKKIVVANMAPGGCIPLLADSITECNATLNMAVKGHNFLLNQTVENLKKESGDSSYYMLDFYNMFTKAYTSGSFKTPYKACCQPCLSIYSKVCDDPNSAFYWDVVHPTNAGWQAVYDQFLKLDLKNIK